jgi:hypothetical protein
MVISIHTRIARELGLKINRQSLRAILVGLSITLIQVTKGHYGTVG